VNHNGIVSASKPGQFARLTWPDSKWNEREK
jgi:hypothetical protein